MAIGSEISSEIGNAYKDGDINKGVQLIAHAALGCGIGEATASDCAAGAAGGVVGEIAGGLYKNSIADDLGADIKNGTLTADKLREYQQNGVDIAKLSGAIAAAMTGADSEGIYAGAGTGQNAAENNAVQALALAAGAVFILGAAGITIVATDKALNGEISNAELGQQFLTAVEMDVKNSYTMGWMFSDETAPDTSKEGFDIHEDKGLILTTPAHENGVYVEEFPVAEDYDNTLVTYPEDNLPDSNDGGFSILQDWLTNLGNVLFKDNTEDYTLSDGEARQWYSLSSIKGL